jgi:hypothetical protein
MTASSIGLAFRWLLAAGGIALAVGCAAPSNHRDWAPDLAVLPYAELDGSRVTIHNVRNCTYLTENEYVVNCYDKSFPLEQLQSVDFLVVPFEGMSSMLAHTMLSFGMSDGSRLAVSVEIRRERNEEYQLISGFLNQYELMYVLGDERDLVKLRTEYRKSEVFLYHAKATPEQVRELFVEVVRRVNKLAVEPEFYNALTNNCTTNIASHINHLAPNRVPYGLGVLLPGYSDRLAYDLGLIESYGTFEETRRRAHINAIATLHRDDPDFSAKIRR